MTKVEITQFVKGTDITVEQFLVLCDTFGETKAKRMVNKERAKSPVVGFLNPYDVKQEIDLGNGKTETRIITKQKLKLALRQKHVAGSPLEKQCINGWLHLIADFTPNANNNGYYVAEDFVMSMQQANTRQAEKENDNGFQHVPWMKGEETSEAVPN
tara:strand:- start:1159 stop:1629 length:471 start_codon:yes stop_codon:yes gene_type:complete